MRSNRFIHSSGNRPSRDIRCQVCLNDGKRVRIRGWSRPKVETARARLYETFHGFYVTNLYHIVCLITRRSNFRFCPLRTARPGNLYRLGLCG
jgi:hypothetical protein